MSKRAKSRRKNYPLSGPSLSQDQRALLAVVAQHMGDKESFDLLDDHLRETGLKVTDQQWEELADVFFANTIDQQQRQFDELNEYLSQPNEKLSLKHFLELTRAMANRRVEEEQNDFLQMDERLQDEGLNLNPAQVVNLATFLTANARRRQKRQFEHFTGVLNDRGLRLDPSQMESLSQAVNARPREEQLRDFLSANEYLEHMPANDLLFSVPEDAKPPQIVAQELDRIESPKVLDVDRKEHRRFAEQEERVVRSGFQGIIGRLRDASGFKQQDIPPEPLSNEEFFLRTAMVVVAFAFGLSAVIYVPGMVRTAFTGQTNDDLMREQMRNLAVEEAMIAQQETTANSRKQDKKTSFFDQSVYHGQPTGQGSGVSSGAPVSTKSMSPEQALITAQKLAAEGHLVTAISAYETYIAANPDEIQPRIELLKVLLSAKKREQAQQLSVTTMKLQMTKEEFKQVWLLMRQSLQI